VGFEPTLEFPLNTLSKRAPSATRPSLRRQSDGGTSLEKCFFSRAFFNSRARSHFSILWRMRRNRNLKWAAHSVIGNRVILQFDAAPAGMRAHVTKFKNYQITKSIWPIEGSLTMFRRNYDSEGGRSEAPEVL
jgi:hypothetical protein